MDLMKTTEAWVSSLTFSQRYLLKSFSVPCHSSARYEENEELLKDNLCFALVREYQEERQAGYIGQKDKNQKWAPLILEKYTNRVNFQDSSTYCQSACQRTYVRSASSWTGKFARLRLRQKQTKFQDGDSLNGKKTKINSRLSWTVFWIFFSHFTCHNLCM